MPLYETVFIARNDISQQQVDAIVGDDGGIDLADALELQARWRDPAGAGALYVTAEAARWLEGVWGMKAGAEVSASIEGKIFGLAKATAGVTLHTEVSMSASLVGGVRRGQYGRRGLRGGDGRTGGVATIL